MVAPGYGLSFFEYKTLHFGAATDLPTTGRVIDLAPPDSSWYLSNLWYFYDVAGGAAATGKVRKITDTSAPNAAASATVVELTGVAGASTVDLTAAARTLREMPLYKNVRARTFKTGQRLAWVGGGTVSPLAGVVIICKWMRTP